MGYPYPPRQPKPRPGVWGVWTGIAMMAAAVVVPVIAVFALVIPQFQLDQRVVPADGRPHSVDLPRGADYAVLVETRTAANAPSCVLADPAGRPIELRPVSGSVTVENRMVLRRFDTGDGAVVATCTPGSGIDEVALGRFPNMGLLLGGIFGALGFAILVGGTGAVLLLVTVIRRANRL